MVSESEICLLGEQEHNRLSEAVNSWHWELNNMSEVKELAIKYLWILVSIKQSECCLWDPGSKTVSSSKTIMVWVRYPVSILVRP